MEEHKRIGKFIRETGHERTSSNFVENVMHRIEASQQSAYEVKPLISMKAWMVVASILLLTVLGTYLWPGETSDSLYMFSKIKEFVPSFSIGIQPPKLSTGFTYGMIALLVVLTVQFGILKRFLDRYYSEQ